MSIQIKDLWSKENIDFALGYLMKKPNQYGHDGLRVSELEKHLKIHREEIFASLQEGRYQPGLGMQKELLFKNGKRRKVVFLCTLDRLILKILQGALSDEIDPILHHSCFAYRKNLGVIDAVRHAKTSVETGREWVVDVDIKNYFDDVSHQQLKENLKEMVDDDILVKLVMDFNKMAILTDNGIRQQTKGIPQGSPLSPLLSNIYLSNFDQWLEGQGIAFYRYGDNIVSFVNSYEEGILHLNEMKEILQNDFQLKINEGKSGVHSIWTRRLLGYDFIKEGEGRITVRARTRESKNRYMRWTQSALSIREKEYHLINEGILCKSDFTLLFENEEKKRRVPVETTDTINIYSNIIFSSDWFHFMNEKRIRVNLFDKFGRAIGSFWPMEHRRSTKLWIKQVALYLDSERKLELAKEMLQASLHNLRTNLRYYRKKRKFVERLSQSVEILSESIKNLKEIQSTEEGMLIEARAKQVYYHSFNDILRNAEFSFTMRTMRPPKDALNAMLSYSYAILYNVLAREVEKTSLDIRISYIHSPNNRRAALHLDLADIYKPIICDRVVFSLINRFEMNAVDDFEKKDQAVWLSESGKRKLIIAFDDKMDSKFTYKGVKISYRELLRDEVVRLRKSIEGESLFKAFRYTT